MKTLGIISLAIISFAAATSAHADTMVKSTLRDSARALKLQDWTGAVRLARTAIADESLSPSENTVAHNNLCIALTNLHDAEALPACNKSVELTNGYWGCLVNRAHLYTQLGERKLAEADYAKAAELNPQATDLRRIERTSPFGENLKFVAMQPKN